MDTIAFDGVEYIKASVAAKKFRYTSDYIGQLCRSKKIDARLVGRTWFVNTDSIDLHRKNKHKKITRVRIKTTGLAIETKLARKVIPPVLKSKTAQALAASNDSLMTIRTLKVSYDRDEESLIPSLTKKKLPPPKTIRIEQVDPTKIRIVSNNKSKTSFLAEKMPDVALSGLLSVGEYSTEEKPSSGPSEDDTVKNIAETPTLEQVKKPVSEVVNQSVAEKAGSKKETVIVSKPVLKMTSAVSMNKTAAAGRPKMTGTPKFTPVAVQVKSSEPPSAWVSLAPLMATFFAIAVSALIWSASSSVVVSESFSESDVIFQVANLIEILDL